LPDVFEEIARIRREGSSASLATVVNAESGVPGKTGFRMLVYPDGTILGTVGGGIVEAKVRGEALQSMQDGKSKLIEYDLDHQSPLGLRCGGKAMVFVEPILAQPRIFIFGAGHIALPLAKFAKELEFSVTVVDDRKEFATTERFPMATEVKLGDFVDVTRSIEFQQNDSIVIVTHGHEHDEVVLKEALSKQILSQYVGLIGSKRKVADLFTRLKEQGVSTERLARVRAPIGLDIGAKTPAEIALCIMAEIIAQKYGKIQNQER
jgi:xanthine dehydrogenase accessory factor